MFLLSIEYLSDILPKHQLNDKSATGETPLDYALKNNHERVASFLKVFVWIVTLSIYEWKFKNKNPQFDIATCVFRRHYMLPLKP